MDTLHSIQHELLRELDIRGIKCATLTSTAFDISSSDYGMQSHVDFSLLHTSHTVENTNLLDLVTRVAPLAETILKTI